MCDFMSRVRNPASVNFGAGFSESWRKAKESFENAAENLKKLNDACMVKCKDCNGQGTITLFSSVETCETCGGKGKVPPNFSI